MLDKLGCFAMGFVFAIVLGVVNAKVRAAYVDNPPINAAQAESVLSNEHER